MVASQMLTSIRRIVHLKKHAEMQIESNIFLDMLTKRDLDVLVA